MATKPPTYEIVRVKLAQVSDNPNNARNIPTDEKELEAYNKKIKDLTDDIKVNGNSAPMVVIRTDDADRPYQVKEGSRRYAAMTALELEEVNVAVIPFKDAVDHELIGLAGNLDREDLTPYDVAKKLVEIKTDHPTMSDNMIATRIGRSKSYVQNLVRVFTGIHPKILKEWSRNNGMAIMSNLVKLVAIEDKAEQWQQWQALCGIETGAPASAEGDATATSSTDEPIKRSPKKAAVDLLASITADKKLRESDKGKFAMQCLQYVLNLRKTFPAGVSAPEKEAE